MTGSSRGHDGRRIAFLGTGLMGAPMARRLLGAGFAVTVWNRDRSKAEALAGDGAICAETPADAVSGADVVITMLTNAEAVKDVLFDRGAADAMTSAATVIDMSSIAPHFARDHAARLAERGIAHVERQERRAAAAVEPAGRGQEIVHRRQGQQDRRGIQQGIGLQRTVHHRHGAAGLVEAAEIGIGPLQRRDHAAGPQ